MQYKRWSKGKRTYKDLLKQIGYEKANEEEILWAWLDEQDWDERNKEVLKDYFTTSMTLEKLGRKYNVGRERIRIIILKMLERIRRLSRRQSLFNRLSRVELWGDRLDTRLKDEYRALCERVQLDKKLL